MPTVLILATSQLNILLDKFSFPSIILFDWKNCHWQRNHSFLFNLIPFYFGTFARILFITTSMLNLFVAYPAGLLTLSKVLVPCMNSVFVFMTLFTDLLILTGADVWLHVTNWCFKTDKWPVVFLQQKPTVPELLRIIRKGNLNNVIPFCVP